MLNDQALGTQECRAGAGGHSSGAWRGRQQRPLIAYDVYLFTVSSGDGDAMAVVMTLTASLIASQRNVILHHNNRLASPNIALIDS